MLRHATAPQGDWTRVDNAVLWDDDLSDTAFRMLLRCLSLGDEEALTTTVTQIAAGLAGGRITVDRARRQLTRKGLLHAVKWRSATGQVHSESVVSTVPLGPDEAARIVTGHHGGEGGERRRRPPLPRVPYAGMRERGPAATPSSGTVLPAGGKKTTGRKTPPSLPPPAPALRHGPVHGDGADGAGGGGTDRPADGPAACCGCGFPGGAGAAGASGGSAGDGGPGDGAGGAGAGGGTRPEPGGGAGHAAGDDAGGHVRDGRDGPGASDGHNRAHGRDGGGDQDGDGPGGGDALRDDDGPMPTEAEEARAAAAERLLLSLRDDDHRLVLGGRDLKALVPIAAEWLLRGATTAHLRAALVTGLPYALRSPRGVLRHRLLDKMPPAPRFTEQVRQEAPPPPPVRPLVDCAVCDAPFRPVTDETRCGGCRVRDARTPDLPPGPTRVGGVWFFPPPARA
ncbi:hypothetical protein LO771_14130 [Streptacidiphilus sp. ASG 303]|uniref:hypothetical protein n=1 Tax=Streptacidiphilus sp. ASG 303 TaxID=2896847 RepID=UPI001E407948|nr:hypothetical protein [Streptacidiphilus sp. ASG 303]MCD0483508.1 hypothetical protein [Streptacidiphilus sp. ASG 303]